MMDATIRDDSGQVLGYAHQTGRDGTLTIHTANGICLVRTAQSMDEARRILEERRHGLPDV